MLRCLVTECQERCPPPGISEDEIMKAIKSCVQNQKDELMKILDVEDLVLDRNLKTVG